MAVKKQIVDNFKGYEYLWEAIIKVTPRLYFLCVSSTDIKDSKISTAVEGRTNKPLWSCSDNSFRFNFFADGVPPPEEKTPPADPPTSLSLTGQSCSFAFNFQIPAVPPAEDMDTAEAVNSSPSSQQRVPEEGPSRSQGAPSACEAPERSKTKKKKKKSGQKKASDRETQQKPTEGSQKEEEVVSK